MSSLATRRYSTTKDESVEQTVDVTVPTAKYPNAWFHCLILRVFAYFPPHQALKEDNGEVDINDLSFYALYLAEFDNEGRSDAHFEYIRRSLEQ